MSPVSYVPFVLHMFPRVICITRVLISQGAMSPVSNVPLILCSPCYMFHYVICSIMWYVHPCSMFHRVRCSPCSMFPLVICATDFMFHEFPVFYVIFQDAMSPLIKCSTDYMFHESYVPRVLCNFPGCYVPPYQMFHWLYVPRVICSPCSM